MHIEIERKFLLIGNGWRHNATASMIRQGYLSTNPQATVRVRISGDRAWLTIKGLNVRGAAPEFEYPIPLDDAAAMLDSLAIKPLIEKKRYRVHTGDLLWEIDEFYGENLGLILAEVELDSQDQNITLPEWIGKEVTGDPRYYNASLTTTPFSLWDK